MPSDLNRVTITGRLTRDPQTPTGTICTMSIAVNGRAKDASGEWIDTASFVDIVAYGHTAEACSRNLVKGRRIGVDGFLRQDHWNTKDGQKRTALKVVAQSIVFLDPKGQQPAADDSDVDVPAEDFDAGGARDDPAF